MGSNNPRVKIGDNSGNTSEDLDGESEIKKLPSNSTLNQTLVRMASLESQKKEISDQLRQLSKDFVASGGTKAALGIIRRVQKMDPDDREDFFAELDAYGTFLRFW
jgi:uncharacterized protein (UPF0335 family)